ncbi:4970_t:CDS:2, partial [Entrophospora sp. SA101]
PVLNNHNKECHAAVLVRFSVTKTKSRKPANTAFKQQRLKAWQPILAPNTVLPTLFIVGIIFAPLGGLLLWASNNVSEISFEYTFCDSTAPVYPIFEPMPSKFDSLK